MIYLVSNQQTLFGLEGIENMSVKKSKEIMKSWKMVQFDTETTGLDPHIDTCLLAQFGSIDKSVQILVDTSTVSLSLYKEELETKFVIGQNLVFDCKVAFNYGIIIRWCYDCMIVEQLLYMGFPHFMIGADEGIITRYCETVDSIPNWVNLKSKERKALLQKLVPDVTEFIENYSGVGLAALCHRYLNQEMSKEIRGQIIWRGLDLAVLHYGAGDVTPLYDIMQCQLKILASRGLIAAAQLECNFVPVCAYYEYCGVHMNVPLWEKKMAKDYDKMVTAEKALNDFVCNYGNPKFFKVDRQGDLFSGFNIEPVCTINWNSSKQVIPFLTLLGFNCRGIDKKSKEEKDSIDASVLKPQRSVNPEFYDIFLAYTEAHKVCSTYGQNYLNAINPKTNRLHTTFRQLGTDTGRLACGSQKQNKNTAPAPTIPVMVVNCSSEICRNRKP